MMKVATQLAIMSDRIHNNQASLRAGAAVRALHVLLNTPILQDSFELHRRDSSRDEGDVEMGMHQPDASDNLKGFFKKVHAVL
jgi:hypothetical protein